MLLKDLPFMSYISCFILFSISSCSSLSWLFCYALPLAHRKVSKAAYLWISGLLITNDDQVVQGPVVVCLCVGHVVRHTPQILFIIPRQRGSKWRIWIATTVGLKKRGYTGFVIHITYDTCVRLVWWLGGKESTCQGRRHESDLWSRRIQIAKQVNPRAATLEPGL